MRAGYGQLERRSGLEYALNEIKFQNALLNMGLIGLAEYVRNTGIRFIARVLPKSLLKKIYIIIRIK